MPVCVRSDSQFSSKLVAMAMSVQLSCWFFSVRNIAIDGGCLSLKNCSHWLAGIHANRLLNSARPKPEHVELNDQSAAKKDWWWLSIGRLPMLNYVCVQMIVAVSFAACSSWKFGKNSWVLGKFSIIWCVFEDLCKLGKQYLNALMCKYCAFSTQNS